MDVNTNHDSQKYYHGMDCPQCHKGKISETSSVFHNDGKVERYYECNKCHCQFTE